MSKLRHFRHQCPPDGHPDGHPVSDWLRQFPLLLWNRWTKFNETWQEARSQCPLASLCFSGRSEKQDGRPESLIGWETFRLRPLKPLKGIQRNLTGSKISTSSTKFVFFGPIGKTKMAALASDWLRHFGLHLWNRWTKLEETWKQALILKVLYEVSVFGSIKKNKKAALPSDWLRHYWLLLWNRWTEFNVTWREARSATFSTKFVLFWPIGKARCPPLPLIGWDIFDFSSETAERNSRKLARKQEFNVIYQVCVFRANRKNKKAALAV